MSLSPDNLMAWCRENMAHYKMPRTVIVTDDLPRNAAGKVSKLHLRTEGGR